MSGPSQSPAPSADGPGSPAPSRRSVASPAPAASPAPRLTPGSPAPSRRSALAQSDAGAASPAPPASRGGSSPAPARSPAPGRMTGASPAARSPAPGRHGGASPGPSGTPLPSRMRGTPMRGAGTPMREGAAAVLGATPGRYSPTANSPARLSNHRGFLGSTPARAPAGVHLDEEDEDLDVDDGNFIYGTDINEKQIAKYIHRFIKNFRLPEAAPEDPPYYIEQLCALWEEQGHKEKGIKFRVSGLHIQSFSQRFYDHLVNFPCEVIPIFDREMVEISVREPQLAEFSLDEMGPVQVQMFQLAPKECKSMRNMNPSDIERLVSIEGIVIRCSDLVPDMASALFRCSVEHCKHEVEVQLSHWTIEEPTRCEQCGAARSFQIIHNDCKFIDKQLLKLQESPEKVEEGETPQNVAVCCFDDLVDVVRPGDRIEVTGVYKATAVHTNRFTRECQAVYRTFVDAVFIAQAETRCRMEQADDALETIGEEGPPMLAEERDLDPEINSQEDIEWNKQIRALALEDGGSTITTKLVQSFAPSIFDEDEVKKGLLCQLFGGTNKVGQQSSKRCRPEIHSLLCGDPSTAKSQLLKSTFKLAPRGVETSGKGSSAVGLTASISRDPVTGETILESGALVLADRGVCCIDEFDKMDENARAILHEAMEQQTVSVAKAGIVTSLNARTAILASANPKGSNYDPKESVVENIHMPKNLMSRFDFIWLMLDKRNCDIDRRLADHLIAMYSESAASTRMEPAINDDLFRRYVAFAKRWVFPKITDESADALLKGYANLRNQGGSGDVITATPRMLESLIRISESLAKMELRESVLPSDVQEAVRLLQAATYTAAMDPETGKIDMEQLIVGVGRARRQRNNDLETMLTKILEEKAERGGDTVITIEQVKGAMNEKLAEEKLHIASEPEFNAALRAAENQGLVRRRGQQLELRA